MLEISVSELKANAGRYVRMAEQQEIYITKNGKLAARLTSAKPDKVLAAKSLFGILPEEADFDRTKMDRFNERSI